MWLLLPVNALSQPRRVLEEVNLAADAAKEVVKQFVLGFKTSHVMSARLRCHCCSR